MFAADFAPERRSARRAPRAAVGFAANLARDGFDRALCQVVDISLHGARLLTYTPLAVGQSIRLRLPRLGEISAQIVWSEDYVVGCRFDHALGDADYEVLTIA